MMGKKQLDAFLGLFWLKVTAAAATVLLGARLSAPLLCLSAADC